MIFLSFLNYLQSFLCGYDHTYKDIKAIDFDDYSKLSWFGTFGIQNIHAYVRFFNFSTSHLVWYFIQMFIF